MMIIMMGFSKDNPNNVSAAAMKIEPIVHRTLS